MNPTIAERRGRAATKDDSGSGDNNRPFEAHMVGIENAVRQELKRTLGLLEESVQESPAEAPNERFSHEVSRFSMCRNLTQPETLC
jgi:hypothetical protein